MAETIRYKGYEITIGQDEYGFSPREWDNLGTMVCFHSRYDLGDKHNMTIEEAKELPSRKDVIVLPLYLYDHSGITMNTTGFSCPWDSGQVGFIYVTKEKAREWMGKRRLTKAAMKEVVDILKSEVEIYDQYLRGDVYYFSILKLGEPLDSCHDIYGYDNALSEAKSVVDADIKHVTQIAMEAF